MMRTLVILLGSLVVAGCGDGLLGFGKDGAVRAERVTFEGLRFRTDVDEVSDDRRDFTVTVRSADQNIAAAQQAAEFEANKYCLGVFGGSEINWTIDPYQDPETVTLGEDDTLTISGRCVRR